MRTIYTSYFGNLRNIPPSIEPIAICGGIPDFFNGKWTKKLAPKWWFFSQWKENHDNDFYITNFKKEVLDKLDPHDIIDMLFNMSDGKIPCMICYEKPGDFCHRHLVAEWLNNSNCDVMVKEWTKDDKRRT